MSKPLTSEKYEQATAYIIICLFRDKAAYIAARTWNSSLQVLALWISFRLVEPLAIVPGALTHNYDERWGHVNSGHSTTTQEAGIASLATKNTLVTDNIYHVFIILPSHVAHFWTFLSSCLVLRVLQGFNHLDGDQVNTGLGCSCLFGFSLSLFSGETALYWVHRFCHGWVTSGSWRPSRWRLSVESKTSIAVSRCHNGAPLSPTLANSLSEVCFVKKVSQMS